MPPCATSRPRWRSVPEVTDFISYVGLPSPIDFNGLVRHYYLRQMPHQAEIRVNLVGKKTPQGRATRIALRLHDRLTSVAEKHGARLKIVETAPRSRPSSPRWWPRSTAVPTIRTTT